MSFQTIDWTGGIDGFVELTDQRLLPGTYKVIRCDSTLEVIDAIQTLAVRGAPAIGAAGAFGVCIAAGEVGSSTVCQAFKALKIKAEQLVSARPTAVNLGWAVSRMLQKAQELVQGRPEIDVKIFRAELLKEAQAVYDEDVQMCRRIGVNAQRFISDGMTILTHCNAGALATTGEGTALAGMYEAARLGKKIKVYADETRPLLQGGRLTAWELRQKDIDVTVITDSAAGVLMQQKKIDMVIVGADRIAANGDTANKIGTYGLSVLAKAHGVDFYVAAPVSTFDMSISSGAEIPIEQRDRSELEFFAGKRIVPESAGVYNPAFDVTPAENITAIITDRAVIDGPCVNKIKKCISGEF